MLYVNIIVELFKALGINAKIEGDKIYFSDIATGNSYTVINDYGYRKIKQDYYHTDNFSFPSKLILEGNNTLIDSLTMDFREILFGKIMIRETVIKVGNKEYLIKLESPYKNIFYKLNERNNDNSYMKILDVYNSGYIESWDEINDVSGIYNGNVPIEENDIKNIDEVINLNEYIEPFIDYYSIFDTRYREIFNNYKMDSSVLKL